ncbi:glycosyltransferase family 2 protein [Tardisphaera saccharovorans]
MLKPSPLPDPSPSPQVSFIIPVGKEGDLTARMRRFRDEVKGLSAEVLLVTDVRDPVTLSSLKALSREGFRCLFITSPVGKGGSIKAAAELCAGKAVVIEDADIPVSPEDVRRALSLLKDDASLVYAERTSREHGALRLFLSDGYNALARLLFRTGVKDHQAGFKVLRRDVIPLLREIRSDGFEFDTELLALAREVGRLVPVQVRWRERRREEGGEGREGDEDGEKGKKEGNGDGAGRAQGKRRKDPKPSTLLPARATFTMFSDLIMFKYLQITKRGVRRVKAGDVIDLSTGQKVGEAYATYVRWRHQGLAKVARYLYFRAFAGCEPPSEDRARPNEDQAAT